MRLVLAVPGGSGSGVSAGPPCRLSAASVAGRLLFVKDGDLWVLDASGAAPAGHRRNVQPTELGARREQPGLCLPRNQLRRHLHHRRPGPEPDAADEFAVDDPRQQRLESAPDVVARRQADRLRVRPRLDVSELWLMNAADGSGRHALATPGLQKKRSTPWRGRPTAPSWPSRCSTSQVRRRSRWCRWHRPGRQRRASAHRPARRCARSGLGARRQLACLRRARRVRRRSVRERPGRHVGDPTDHRRPARALAGLESGRRQLAYLSNKTGFFEMWVVDCQSTASGGLVASSPRQLTQDLHLDATSGLSWGR